MDNDDVGIFMKQESVMSLYEPTPMTPTSTKSFIPTPMPDIARSAANSSTNMKRNVSYGNLDTNEARVLVLYTGGTIGMLRNEKNGECFFI